MALRINKEVVQAMGQTGFSRAEIARRIGCSEKQVRRILGPVVERSPKLIDDAEVNLREFYKEYETGNRAAARFGITRQAIYQSK